MWSLFWNQIWSLTDVGVKAGVCFEDVVSREVDGVAGKAEAAADGGFWMQLRNGFNLGRGAGSCKGGGLAYISTVMNTSYGFVWCEQTLGTPLHATINECVQDL